MRYIPFVSVACMCGAGLLALPQARIVDVNVSQEMPGSEPAHFLGIVGHWVVGSDGYRNVLMEDGSKWKPLELQAGLEQRVRTLFGEGHQEFLKTTKAFPEHPFAVAQGIDNFKQGVLWVRFQLVDGTRDRSAGILFNLKPNGDYLAVQFKGDDPEKGDKEQSHRLSLWSFVNGKSKLLKIGSTEAIVPLKSWDFIQVAVDGTIVVASVGNKPLLDYTLTEPVSGKIGVWTSGDSVTYFDDYKVVLK